MPDAPGLPGSYGEPLNSRPLYQVLADDLVRRMSGVGAGGPIPSAHHVARLYQIPPLTAEFVRRGAITRLRVRMRPAPTAVVGPMWRRVAEMLWHDIRDGHFAEQLPTRGELAHFYGVSIDTVSRAVHYLEASGVVAREGQRGTRICRPLREPDLPVTDPP